MHTEDLEIVINHLVHNYKKQKTNKIINKINILRMIIPKILNYLRMPVMHNIQLK